jgi:hypothetical protein
MLFGRTYTKVVTWQNDVTSAPIGGLLSRQFISTPTPLPTPKPYVATRIGDPNAAPVVTATTTAPVVLVTNAQQPRLSQVVVEQNFPEQIPPPTPAPLVINNCFDTPPPRGIAILAAAAADIFFSGSAVIATTSAPKYIQPTLKIFYNPTDTAVAPSATTAQPVVTTQNGTSPQKVYVNVEQAVYDSAQFTSYTSEPAIYSFTTPSRKPFVFIKREYTPAGVFTESTGAGLPNFVIGIVRTTSIVADALRTTLARGITRTSLPVGTARSTAAPTKDTRLSRTSSTARNTSGIVNERTTEAS